VSPPVVPPSLLLYENLVVDLDYLYLTNYASIIVYTLNVGINSSLQSGLAQSSLIKRASSPRFPLRVLSDNRILG